MVFEAIQRLNDSPIRQYTNLTIQQFNNSTIHQYTNSQYDNQQLAINDTPVALIGIFDYIF